MTTDRITVKPRTAASPLRGVEVRAGAALATGAAGEPLDVPGNSPLARRTSPGRRAMFPGMLRPWALAAIL